MDDIPFFWIVLAVVVIAILVSRRKRKPRASATGPHLGVDVDSDLIMACHGDRAMAKRLIEHEMNQRPDLTPTGAALMALSRLRDDQR